MKNRNVTLFLITCITFFCMALKSSTVTAKTIDILQPQMYLPIVLKEPSTTHIFEIVDLYYTYYGSDTSNIRRHAIVKNISGQKSPTLWGPNGGDYQPLHPGDKMVISVNPYDDLGTHICIEFKSVHQPEGGVYTVDIPCYDIVP